MVEQMPGELQGQILEGQSRAVKQFQGEDRAVDLHQRHRGGVREAGISAPAHRLQVFERYRVADKGGKHFRGQLRIRQAAQGTQLGGGETRPALGHIQPAIFPQPGQQHA